MTISFKLEKNTGFSYSGINHNKTDKFYSWVIESGEIFLWNVKSQRI